MKTDPTPRLRAGHLLRCLLPLAGAALLLSGCGLVGVKPWERDLMARKSMQLDPHPLITAADDHIHFAKEASSGGRSFAGGGCGCN